MEKTFRGDACGGGNEEKTYPQKKRRRGEKRAKRNWVHFKRWENKLKAWISLRKGWVNIHGSRSTDTERGGNDGNADGRRGTLGLSGCPRGRNNKHWASGQVNTIAPGRKKPVGNKTWEAECTKEKSRKNHFRRGNLNCAEPEISRKGERATDRKKTGAQNGH